MSTKKKKTFHLTLVSVDVTSVVSNNNWIAFKPDSFCEAGGILAMMIFSDFIWIVFKNMGDPAPVRSFVLNPFPYQYMGRQNQ